VQILGYVAYVVLCFLAVTWTIGVRVKLDAAAPVILGALFFVGSAIILATLGIDKLHALWLIVVGFAVSVLIAPVLLNVPLISLPIRILATFFAGIVRVGIPSNKIRAAQEAAMRAAIDDLLNTKENTRDP
jgi:hypothetical protein